MIAFDLVLASASTARARLLRQAGLRLKIRPAHLDETALTAALVEEGADAPAIAEALAEAKAVKVAAMEPGALVLGADQVLDLDRALLDKPNTRPRAEAQLALLAGKTHRLVTAMVLARDGVALWRASAEAKLTMRPLDPQAIARYLDAAGPEVLACVGAYQIEGLGISLFDRVEGCMFAIQGLDLVPLLRQLRLLGVGR